MRTALVLSAGGMFGAWQAGVWQGLAGRLRPGVVIGASVGALNGWAIAGLCPPEELAAVWLDPSIAILRLRLTRPWLGIFDRRLLRTWVERLHRMHTPRLPFGAVAVELPALRSRLFLTPEVGSRHLLASCSIPGGYPPVRIGGRWYCDGGLLGALPVWAAAQAGAGRVLALNALPAMPSRAVRWFVGGVRALARPPAAPAGLETVVAAPSEPLGSLADMLYWKERNIRRWLEMGRRDAKTISLPECFERQ